MKMVLRKHICHDFQIVKDDKLGLDDCISIALDFPTFLDAKQALWTEGEKQNDHGEGCCGLEVGAEIPACEVLYDADHQGAKDGAGDGVEPTKDSCYVTLHEHLIHHFRGHIDDWCDQHACESGQKAGHAPGQEHNETHRNAHQFGRLRIVGHGTLGDALFSELEKDE